MKMLRKRPSKTIVIGSSLPTATKGSNPCLTCSSQKICPYRKLDDLDKEKKIE